MDRSSENGRRPQKMSKSLGLGTKGERTRRRLVERCAALFNRNGYRASSLGDVVEATGAPKGSLYFHFGSKEALTKEVLSFALDRGRERYAFMRDDAIPPREAMTRLLATFAETWAKPTIPGGCPLFNAAVESARIDEASRVFTAEAFDSWRARTSAVLARGVADGSFPPVLDPEAFASVIHATYHGALVTSRLAGDPVHLARALAHLADILVLPRPAVAPLSLNDSPQPETSIF